MWVQCLGGEDSLANHMAAHFTFLAWRTPMDRGTWWATVRRVAKSQTPVKLLSTRQSDLPRALGLPFGRDGGLARVLLPAASSCQGILCLWCGRPASAVNLSPAIANDLSKKVAPSYTLERPLCFPSSLESVHQIYLVFSLEQVLGPSSSVCIWEVQ